MKIVCPSCAASYDVPDAVGLSKRTVRCARCGTDWVPGAGADEVAPHTVAPEAAPAPAEPAAAAVPDIVPDAESDIPATLEPGADVVAPQPETEVHAAPEPAARRPVPRQSSAAAIAPGAVTAAADGAPRQPMGAWALSLAVLVALGGAAIAFRAPIMQAWPPSTRLYASVGLYHPDTAR